MMTPSEELMLLFELNGYDVTKFRLKKYLEFDQATNNVNLYQQKTLKDLLIAHYTYTSDISELHKNPLTYQRSWALEIDSLDEFYVSHIDIEEEMTLKEFIQLDSLNTLTKESILYDVFDQWIEEYRNASIQQMENLERLIELLPKKIKKQRKPSLIAFLITTIIALLMAFLYRSKETLTPAMLPFLTPFVDKLHTLLYDWPLYSLFGVTVITLLVGHSVLNLFFKKFIKDVRGEKSKHAKRMFKKWNQDMEKARIKQSGVFEDYVER
ncbi:MAG: hypothetical protein K9L26_02560, partial [Candidatus Izimaplasma sp.]|nr:hypothetical protein [Candidatus Izimaplasma bacterium]